MSVWSVSATGGSFREGRTNGRGVRSGVRRGGEVAERRRADLAFPQLDAAEQPGDVGHDAAGWAEAVRVQPLGVAAADEEVVRQHLLLEGVERAHHEPA